LGVSELNIFGVPHEIPTRDSRISWVHNTPCQTLRQKKPYFHRAYGLPWTLLDFKVIEARTESSNQNEKTPHADGTLPLRRGVVEAGGIEPPSERF